MNTRKRYLESFAVLLYLICLCTMGIIDSSNETLVSVPITYEYTFNEELAEKIQPIMVTVDDNDSDDIENDIYVPTEEDINEEIRLGEMELLAQLCQAEAGNQGLEGMRYVADVVLNRVDDERFPDTVEEVIFQTNQFSVTSNGAFDKAAWNMTEDAYKAVELEWDERLDDGIIYFSSTTDPVNGCNAWKYEDHWFSY